MQKKRLVNSDISKYLTINMRTLSQVCVTTKNTKQTRRRN